VDLENSQPPLRCSSDLSPPSTGAPRLPQTGGLAALIELEPTGEAIGYCSRMALNATLYSFEVRLNDSDRQVYETLAFRAAQHPSETCEYLLTRVLAYCLEYTEGLSFSKGGLSDPDSPALEVRDLSGTLLSWIEIGLPEPARLHKATKAARRVAVYSYKDVTALVARIAAEAVFRGDEIEIYAVDRELIAALAARLGRRMSFDLVATDRHLYVSLGDETFSGSVQKFSVQSI
jgi:uncharacterized protein YaeQ